MRLLVVSDHYPPHSTGGYDIACHAFTTKLQERGHDVAIVTSNFVADPGLGATSGAQRRLHRPQDSSSLVEQLLWEQVDGQLLRRVLRQHQPDAIYAWKLFQLFPSLHRILAAADAPLLYNIQDTWIPDHLAAHQQLRAAWRSEGHRVRNRVRRSAGRMLTTLGLLEPSLSINDLRLDAAVFCSASQRDRLARGLPLRDHTVIPNGVDLTVFHGRREATRPETLRALFVGRMVAEKGAHVALDAVRQARAQDVDVQLTLAGLSSYPWDYEQELRQRAGDPALDGFVSFVGAVANGELPALHARHDVLLFPSACIEGLPMTVIEAMASGLPVIGTVTGGTSEVLRSGINGLAIEVGDAAAMAAHLVVLARERPLLERLAEAALHTARTEFDIEAKAAETEAYLEATVAAWRCGERKPGVSPSNRS